MPDLAIDLPLDVHGYRRVGTTENRWYIAGLVNGTALTTVAFVANRLYAYPFIASVPTTINDIGVNVSTAVASSLVRLGVYNDNGNLYPNALLVDAGTVSSAAIAFVSVAISGTLKLRPGLYWLVAVSGHAPTVRAPALGSSIPILGTDNVAGTTATGIGWDAAHTMGVLPSTYPASATVRTAAAHGIYARCVA